MHEANPQLLDEVVCDVFSFALSGTLNFNFYEECATILSIMRAVFKRCLYQLPREHVEAAWLRRDGVEYERKRPFTGHWYDQTLVEGHWRSRYRVKGHPLTLKRYAVDTLHLEFCK